MIRTIFLTCLLVLALGCEPYVDTENTGNFIINKINTTDDEYYIKTSEEFIRIKIKDVVIFETYYAGGDDILQCEIYKDKFGTSVGPINGKYILLLQPETIEKLKESK